MGKRRNGAVLGLTAFLIAVTTGEQALSCSTDAIDIRTEAGVATYSIEIADDAAERAQGLMFRDSMPRDHGMYFVYPTGRPVAFWMKNTPLPLDIIYINERGVICSIAADTTPYSEEALPSGCADQTVLELNAGEAKAAGIRVGAPVRHPAVVRPAWKCE